MLKKLLWLTVVTACVVLFWRFGYQATLRYFFKLSGTVALAAGASGAAAQPNNMLFIVVKNSSGVPVAVKKIINPAFPAPFEITPGNLIMPDLLTRRLTLEAFVNTHGRLGEFRRGDLRGTAPDPVAPFQKEIALQVAAD